MRDTSPNTQAGGRLDPDSTFDAPSAHPSAADLPLTPGENAYQRRETPLETASIQPLAGSRATLTVLTGMHAGRLAALEGEAMTIGRAADVDLMVDDTSVSRHHARVARTPEGAFYAEDLDSKNGTFLGVQRIGIALLRGGDQLQLGPHLHVRFAIVDPIEESLYRRLYETSTRDPLTHTYNRRYLVDRLVAEVAHARRTNGEVVVLMVDVDCLKDVNDRFGHLAGDRALCTIAARIQSVLRVEDILARYGGDEFIVVAIGAARPEAAQLAERVRRAVTGLETDGAQPRITASVGLASLAELDTSDEPVGALLAAADAGMYDAKAAGRNRVSAAGSIGSHASIDGAMGQPESRRH
jgi:two-component system cell cycle response regulator